VQLAAEPPPPPPFDNGAVSGSFRVEQLSVWLPVDQAAAESAPREEVQALMLCLDVEAR